MCGIVGYIGEQKALPILMEGLKRLEYRGYDSAGLAFIHHQDFQILRSQGKLHNLSEKIQSSQTQFDSQIGIGHTRWATHGKPNEQNAHPHHSKDFVLVHNGIIENHIALKKKLLENGYKFGSETDTEVICHLIQDHYNKGADVFEAICLSLNELKGAYSLVIMHRESPDQIYIAKKGSPLVVGIKSGETFVASDIPALLPYTREVIFLEDNELGVLKKDQVQFYNFKGEDVPKQSRIIQWTLAQAEKGGYKHFMLKEIFEQPRVLAECLMGRISFDEKEITLEGVDEFLNEQIQSPGFSIKILACGTSYHAGLVAKYWIESLARIPVDVELASEFRYREPMLDSNALVIPISQSGETADTLAAVAMAKQKQAKVLAVCNVIESSISRESDLTLYTHAGPEVGVASTKAFTTQLVVLYLLALKFAHQKSSLHQDAIYKKISDLLKLPSAIDKILKNKQKTIKSFADQIATNDHCYFLGRNIQYPIVLEGALKLKEISYIHAEGYAGGEMKHGPIALIEENIPVVGITLKDSVYEKSVSNLVEVEARGANIMTLISEGDEELQKRFKNCLEIPHLNSDLNPFLTVVPLQLLSYYVADKKGTDVDQPRNLAKSVTVE